MNACGRECGNLVQSCLLWSSSSAAGSVHIVILDNSSSILHFLVLKFFLSHISIPSSDSLIFWWFYATRIQFHQNPSFSPWINVSVEKNHKHTKFKIKIETLQNCEIVIICVDQVRLALEFCVEGEGAFIGLRLNRGISRPGTLQILCSFTRI